jgi:hypothetical protein
VTFVLEGFAIFLAQLHSVSIGFPNAIIVSQFRIDISPTNVCRSSVHGKGLSRFWSCVEGYKGPMLVLLSAFCNGGADNVHADRRWGIGVLTEEGFENKDTFYGSSGFLCATNPIFHMLQPFGMM